MMKKWIAVGMMTAVLFAGCAAAEPAAGEAQDMGRDTSVQSEITVEQVLYEYNSSRKAVTASLYEDDVHAPITVTRCACRIDDSYIIYPKVEGEAGERINSEVCRAALEQAEKLGIPVLCEYQVEYNRNGIFSIRMFVYDMQGENEKHVECIPLTFNSATGDLLKISDLFDEKNQTWRGRIPDIIAAQAADCDMVLLNEILPIADDRPFYITDEAVVIVYDLYEIATYAAGEPEFEIAVDQLAECIAPDSILNVMLPRQADADPAFEAEKSIASVVTE